MLIGIAALSLVAGPDKAVAQSCTSSNTKVANVVALDQVFFWNRLGAVQPQGMIFALRRNVIAKSGIPSAPLVAGQVMLKKDKRPRPIVLRMNVGDCLQINFTNLLAGAKVDEEQPATREASVRVMGMQLVGSIASDGSYVGKNANSTVAPGGSATYTFYAEREGTHLLYSQGTTTGGEGDGGSLNAGLFGSVNVEPKTAEYYRSQVTQVDLALATKGTTTDGHPIINYNATYPAAHPLVGLPILKLTSGNEIVHSDLTAIITGPNAGIFSTTTYPQVKVSPQRNKPFREFTIIYHDEVGAVQAFPHFKEKAQGLVHTLHGVRDAFAFNYGTGGVGAEVIANRLGVGPMFDCPECFYEEFFLTSWVVGDPAQVVDVPANAPCKKENLRDPDRFGGCAPTPGRKATKVLYPDDPSNVYHSYIGDHTKMRIVHGGSKEHHIHHLHAHQWLRTPDSDNSSYLDSQAFGPGYSFTTDITYGGGGNRNQTVGDAIFHCHFYPHFAMGMWALWRNHDVFEAGTVLDSSGRPAAGSRALPDNEILAGTPIPAIVPLPTYGMAPMPQRGVSIVNGQVVLGAITKAPGNPGFPFFVPGLAGHRPPAPPLDFAPDPAAPGKFLDGGLPRHVIKSGTAFEEHTRLSFDKFLLTADAEQRPEDGTPEEKAAMTFHEAASWPTFKPDGTVATFITNGKPRVSGAPYAEPCKGDPITPNPPIRHITYKAAGIQFDLAINKSGWHTPQTRILTLWKDVEPTLNGTRPAEPLFFRANTYDCISFWHTNLIPRVYRQDDFQVRTPTDIIGQHIHLVKFDVTSSDGAGNGYNYEDGTLSPEEVRDVIHAINLKGGLIPYGGGARVLLTPKAHPFFGRPEWVGAQTTIQRWFVDDTLNLLGQDRTLQTVFTHDHFGPSTHQQIGLYAGLVVEKRNAQWKNDETGAILGNSPGGVVCGPGSPLGCDGTPTSWRAIITTPVVSESFREFLLEFADFHLAYYKNGGVDGAGNAIADPRNAINPPAKEDEPLPVALAKIPLDETCPDGTASPPCPEAISAADPGTMTVNYRNEPTPLRIWDPVLKRQAAGVPGDLSMVFRSNVTRMLPELNTAPTGWAALGVPPLSKGVLTGDPITPLMRAYQKDNVRIRVLVGAHEEGHNFSVNGGRWFFEPGVPSSGLRNSQMMGISEHFELIMPRLINPFDLFIDKPFADYLYAPGSSVGDLWNGLWGIFRLYQNPQADLVQLPNNPLGSLLPVDKTSLTTSVMVNIDTDNDSTITTGTDQVTVDSSSTTILDPTDAPDFGLPESPSTSRPIGTIGGFIGIFEKGVCPLFSRFRIFDISAVRAMDVLPVNPFVGQRTLVYNRRLTQVDNIDPKADTADPDNQTRFGPLHDPTAIMFVQTRDLAPDSTGVLRLKPDVRVEPLVLRANAGDCIAVILRNRLPVGVPAPDLDGWNELPLLLDDFNFQFRPFGANQIRPSNSVGLHPQLLTYNVHRSDGNNVGFNRISTAAPGSINTYLWYAGTVNVSAAGQVTFTPVEFGATNLIPSDRIKHSNKGAFGSLIIEPTGSTWTEDTYMDAETGLTKKTRASVTVTPPNQPLFREFVTMFQNDVNLRYRDNFPVKNMAGEDDTEDSGQAGLNYRTEPLWFRMGHLPQTPANVTRDLQWAKVLSNGWIGHVDPETPVFTASVASAVRFRVLMAGGHSRNNVFALHGHIWEEEPWNSTGTGQVYSNIISEWKGAEYGVGATFHQNMLLKNGAGGFFRVPGDYLYRTFQSSQFDNGIWGIFRVQAVGSSSLDTVPPEDK
jgi:hypothetical protein